MMGRLIFIVLLVCIVLVPLAEALAQKANP